MPTILSPRVTGSRLMSFLSINSHDLIEVRIFADGQRVGRHDLADLAAVLVDEIGSRVARAENEFQEATVLALGADLGTTNKVALRNYTDQFADRADHGQAADMPVQHGVCGFNNRGLGCHGDDWTGHDLVSAHRNLRGFEIELRLLAYFNPESGI